MKIGCLFVFLSMLCSSLAYADEVSERTDYLAFANGARVTAVSATELDRIPGVEKAMLAIDGNQGTFSLTPKFATQASTVSITLELPAVTRFTEFVVPNVTETPSPYQTFVKQIDVYGGAGGDSDDFVLLSKAELRVSTEQIQDVKMQAKSVPVRKIRIDLRGGLSMEKDKAFLEFSEIIGYGQQEPVPLSDAFSGIWKGRGVNIELRQDGASVIGCYDKTGRLTGTVDGNILRAVGEGLDDGVFSAFVLLLDEQQNLDGVRSSNGAPFRRYAGNPIEEAADSACFEPEPALLGCGAILHGIRFDYDSADIRPESDTVIKSLYEGLSADNTTSTFIIEGHTSSEGSESYNQALAERRAGALRERLVSMGISASRLESVGVGETRPIASNDDEAGRSLNRRVEVRCR